MVVEIPGSRSVGVGLALAGAALTAIGSLLLFDAEISWGASALLLGLGVPTLLVGLSRAVFDPPRLRATPAGISIGGRAQIPWTDVKQVYVASMDVSSHGLHARTSAVAIDFLRKRTLFRTPVLAWLASPFTVGDVDISVGGRPDPVASQLEAMRVLAVGAEDGVVVGSSPVPAARLVDR